MVTFRCEDCGIEFDKEGVLVRGDDWEFIPEHGTEPEIYCPNDVAGDTYELPTHDTSLVSP